MHRYVALLIAGTVACASPHAPSPPASSHTLTLRVLARTAETPIANATIHQNGVYVGRTDTDGSFALRIQPGWIGITVIADTYRGFTAEAEVFSDERWSFYLEPH